MTLKCTNQKIAVFCSIPCRWAMNIDYVLPLLLFLYSNGTDNIHNITHTYVYIYTYTHKTFSSLTYEHSPCIICYHNHYHRVFLGYTDFSPEKAREGRAREHERERASDGEVNRKNASCTARTNFFGRASVRYKYRRYRLTQKWTRCCRNVSKIHAVRSGNRSLRLFPLLPFNSSSYLSPPEWVSSLIHSVKKASLMKYFSASYLYDDLLLDCLLNFVCRVCERTRAQWLLHWGFSSSLWFFYCPFSIKSRLAQYVWSTGTRSFSPIETILIDFLTFSQAQNDDTISNVKEKRQYDQYPYNSQRYPQPPPARGYAPSEQKTPDEDTQAGGCKGCGPRRDCQCPGKGAMGITGMYIILLPNVFT